MPELTTPQKITPFLWFDRQAEEAIAFYTSLFPDSRVRKTTRYPDHFPNLGGLVMTIDFELAGQPFVALNGGPHYHFTPAISLFIGCDDQVEVDHYWNAFADGGTPSQCGWISDRFGLTWQVCPRVLPSLITDPDPKKARAAMDAMMTMAKIDLATIERAHAAA